MLKIEWSLRSKDHLGSTRVSFDSSESTEGLLSSLSLSPMTSSSSSSSERQGETNVGLRGDDDRIYKSDASLLSI